GLAGIQHKTLVRAVRQSNDDRTANRRSRARALSPVASRLIRDNQRSARPDDSAGFVGEIQLARERRLPSVQVTSQARRWPNTPNCASTPVSRSTSAIDRAPGPAAPAKTPTDCYGSTSRRER